MMEAKHLLWVKALVISFLLDGALICFGESVRTFTDINGRAVRGILVNYDTCNETVTIQREEDNRTCEAPFSLFSAEDGAYILDFHKRHSISISAKLFESDDVDGFKSTEYDNDHIKNLYYKVTFRNRSGAPFRDVNLDYCIFYEQHNRKKTSVWKYEGVQCGNWKLGAVKNREVQTVETPKILLCDKQTATTLFGQAPGDRGQITGLWIRATITLSNGERTVKELRVPEQIKHERAWTSATVMVGLNAEKARRYPGVGKEKYVQSETP